MTVLNEFIALYIMYLSKITQPVKIFIWELSNSIIVKYVTFVFILAWQSLWIKFWNQYKWTEKKKKECAFFALLISRIFYVAQIAGWSLTGRVQRRVYLPIAYRSTRTIVSAGLLQVSHVARIAAVAVANFITWHRPLILHRVSNV